MAERLVDDREMDDRYEAGLEEGWALAETVLRGCTEPLSDSQTWWSQAADYLAKVKDRYLVSDG